MVARNPDPDSSLPYLIRVPLPGRPIVDAATAATGTSPQFNKAGPLKDFIRDQEVAYIHRILAQTEGDKEEAARVLGVSLATLYRKLAEEPAAAE